MNRKQKAMEEKYKFQGITPRRGKKLVDDRDEATVEQAIKEIRGCIKYEHSLALAREYYSMRYKHGQKVFDLALKLWESPLMRALS